MLLDLLNVGHWSALGKSIDRVLDLSRLDVLHPLSGCEGLLEFGEKTCLVAL